MGAGRDFREERGPGNNRLSIIKRGNGEPFKLKPYCPWHVPAMPDKMGAFHLSSLMSAAAPCATLPELQAVSHTHLGPGLDAEFAAAYWALRSAYLQRWPQATLFLAANSVRLNSVQRELFDRGHPSSWQIVLAVRA